MAVASSLRTRGGSGVELARPLVFVEDVGVRRAAMRDWDGGDPVTVAVELLAGLQLDEVELIADSARRPLRQRDQLAQARRAVNRERALARPQVEGLQHSGQPGP